MPFRGRACPKCKSGKIVIDCYRSGGSGVVWDAVCVNCGVNVAQWLPGHAGWQRLVDEVGRRIPNPHNLPGYGVADLDEDE